MRKKMVDMLVEMGLTRFDAEGVMDRWDMDEFERSWKMQRCIELSRRNVERWEWVMGKELGEWEYSNGY